MSDHGPRTQTQVALNKVFHCEGFIEAFIVTEQDSHKSMYLRVIDGDIRSVGYSKTWALQMSSGDILSFGVDRK